MTASSALWAQGLSFGSQVGRLLGLAGARTHSDTSADEATASYIRILHAQSPMTAEHSERVARYAVALALALDLPWQAVRRLERCGLLHDMGKIGVEEEILAKPGALTDAEWQVIRTHPEIGAQILSTSPALADVLPAVALHHERFDGKGYPHGTGGADLPLEARIISICDAYDSMTADRPYRRGMASHEAVRRLTEGAGNQWDPELVPIFVNHVLPALAGGLDKAS